jgi:hypothetical protein
MLKVSALPPNIAGRARVVSPLLNLGDPSLMIGS